MQCVCARVQVQLLLCLSCLVAQIYPQKIPIREAVQLHLIICGSDNVPDHITRQQVTLASPLSCLSDETA